MNRDIVAIVVNYNTGGLLKRAVDSLLAGSVRPAIEIVDNASRDDSFELIRTPAYKDVVSITINARNLGFAAANNQVLRRRTAEYYLLMNPDCVLDGNAVAELVRCMESNPGVGLAGAALTNSDGTIQKTSKRKFPTPWSALGRTLGLHRFGLGNNLISDFDLARQDTRPDEMEIVEAVSGALMFVRGAALTRVGLLDEGFFMHCEDLDWCKRFSDAGYKVAYVPSARAMHCKGGSGRGPRVIWYLHRGMIRFYSKHYRGKYPLLLTGLIYAAIYARCGVLMALSLVPGRP